MTENFAAAVIVVVTLLIFGVVFLKGRGAWLIARYQMLPKAERDRYDERALCRFMAKLLFYLAGCVALLGANELWPGRGFALVGGILLSLGIVFTLIHLNTKERFLKK